MMSLLKKLRQIRRLGFAGSAWVLYVLCIAPILHRGLVPLYELGRQLALRSRYRNLGPRFDALRARADLVKYHRSTRVRTLRDLCPELEAVVARRRAENKIIPLALIDRSGHGVPLFGSFWSDLVVPAVDFRPCYRHAVLIVDVGGYVGILKNFRNHKPDFVNELEVATALLAAGCNVPEILHVDFDRLEIVYSYIPGILLREALVRAGANFAARPKSRMVIWFRHLWRFHAKEGRPRIASVLNSEEIARLGAAFIEIHRAGYTLEDVKYGNIIIENGTNVPFFIDFERACSLKGLSRGLSTYMRDRDCTKLNAGTGADLLTAAGLRKLRKLPGGPIYAPVYLGHGIRWGAIWNPDVGVGRWRYIMEKQLPVPKGGRILDLGANNGYNALQMLRAGAREVVAVELSPGAIEQGLFLKRAYEWRDNAPYHLSYVHGSHGDLPSMALGRFDHVTAFCTLYYLPREQMSAAVRHIRSLSNVLVQQANTDRLIHRKDEDTFEKASLEFTKQLAAEGGFDKVRVVAPRGYSRPLVISEATSAAGEAASDASLPLVASASAPAVA